MGIGTGLGIVMQTRNQRADFFIATAVMNADEILHGDGEGIFTGIMLLELLIQRFDDELTRLAFVEHGNLRIEAELMKMFAHQAKAKSVKCSDVTRVK